MIRESNWDCIKECYLVVNFVFCSCKEQWVEEPGNLKDGRAYW